MFFSSKSDLRWLFNHSLMLAHSFWAPTNSYFFKPPYSFWAPTNSFPTRKSFSTVQQVTAWSQKPNVLYLQPQRGSSPLNPFHLFLYALTPKFRISPRKRTNFATLVTRGQTTTLYNITAFFPLALPVFLMTYAGSRRSNQVLPIQALPILLNREGINIWGVLFKKFPSSPIFSCRTLNECMSYFESTSLISRNFRSRKKTWHKAALSAALIVHAVVFTVYDKQASCWLKLF